MTMLCVFNSLTLSMKLLGQRCPTPSPSYEAGRSTAWLLCWFRWNVSWLQLDCFLFHDCIWIVSEPWIVSLMVSCYIMIMTVHNIHNVSCMDGECVFLMYLIIAHRPLGAGLKPRYELHHGVRISDRAVVPLLHSVGLGWFRQEQH